jgi:hypothetical protein
MKKSKLIKLLNTIKGDPDIKLWNGMVGDWVDIDPTLVPVDLVRMTLTTWLDACRWEDRINRKDPSYELPADEVADLKKRYSAVCKWETNPYTTADDIKSGKYITKHVYIMQAKIKGESSWDRAGTIEY